MNVIQSRQIIVVGGGCGDDGDDGDDCVDGGNGGIDSDKVEYVGS